MKKRKLNKVDLYIYGNLTHHVKGLPRMANVNNPFNGEIHLELEMIHEVSTATRNYQRARENRERRTAIILRDDNTRILIGAYRVRKKCILYKTGVMSEAHRKIVKLIEDNFKYSEVDYKIVTSEDKRKETEEIWAMGR